MKINEATFGAGCFWGVEEHFRMTEGVTMTEVGFMGGKIENPTYEQVCYENTGHAEVVHLEFDSSTVSYKSLVYMFFSMHNPAQRNGQGVNIGSQYRSVIFFYTNQQKKEAEEVLDELQNSKQFQGDIVTQIEPATEFYRAEEYHQQYVMRTKRNVC